MCGVSGVGKSTILNTLVSRKLCEPVIKYSNRKSFSEIDDITTVTNIFDKELGCDIVYSMYGNLYGFNSNMIMQALQERNQILITNNIRAIDMLKKIFPQQVVSIYILSNISKINLLEVYLKRLGFPDLEPQRGEIQKCLKICSDSLKTNDSQAFFESCQAMYTFLETLLPDYEKYRMRVKSIENLSINYTKNFFYYDYVVLNLYTADRVEDRITESAFAQLREIIYKETKE